MSQFASKEARPTHPSSIAFRKAELLAQNYAPNFWKRWSGFEAPKLTDFLVFGSTARGADEVHDVDCAVVFQSVGDLEEEQRKTLQCLAFAERLANNRNNALAKVPVDLIPIPDTYFRHACIRDYLNRIFVGDDFLYSVFNTSRRLDVTGRFVPADWSYFVREYARAPNAL